MSPFQAGILAGLFSCATIAQLQDLPDLNQPILREAPLPDGDQLMHEVRMQLPVQPLDLSGFIQTRDKETRKKTRRELETSLRFGDAPPHARYDILSPQGTLQHSLHVNWTTNRIQLVHRDSRGQALQEAPSPQDAILDTGITWSDLSLDFLWWPAAKAVGRDSIKTRPCVIVEIPAPPDRPDLYQLRAWIDTKARFVVKAELLNRQGERLKKIEVDSIKEIRDDVWMVKDLEVRDYQNKRRSLIRIEDVTELEK